MNRPNPEQSTRHAKKFDAFVRKAGVLLILEHLTPYIVGLLSLVCIFVSLSWLGLFLYLPVDLRIFVDCLFFCLSLLIIGKCLWYRLPNRLDITRRLDRECGSIYRPASSFLDQLANNTSGDPLTRALWQEHQQRVQIALATIKLPKFNAELPEYDPYALRCFALVLLVAAAFIAGKERLSRLELAVNWRSNPSSHTVFRLDGWITPPPYTLRPPFLLNFTSDDAEATVNVPEQSTITIRSSDGSSIDITRDSGLELERSASDNKSATTNAAVEGEYRFKLIADSHLQIARDGNVLGKFQLHAIKDTPPTIQWQQKPQSNLRGTLQLSYTINDDYGVVSAEARVGDPNFGKDFSIKRSLIGPPKIPLNLPASSNGLGNAQTIADLSRHPWAGAKVNIVLIANDEAGHAGSSESLQITLPKYPFAVPLAKALIEQRRNLILAADDRVAVATALDALAMGAEEFSLPPAQYIGLRVASLRLAAAKSDDDLRDLADYLWNMALQIEDGNFSKAEQDLRAAREDLRETMIRKSSPDEIRKKVEHFKQALDKYLKELAQKLPNDPQTNQPEMSENEMASDEFQNLLDQMQQLAEAGDMKGAEDLLNQMQQMMENLDTAEQSELSEKAKKLVETSKELNRITRDLERLNTNTFVHIPARPPAQNIPDTKDKNDPAPVDQDKNRPASEPDKNSQVSPGTAVEIQEDLVNRQKQLSDRLEKLLDNSARDSLSDSKLEQVLKDMQDAEKALRKGPQQNDSAAYLQGQALKLLRQDLQAMIDQMRMGAGAGKKGYFFLMPGNRNRGSSNNQGRGPFNGEKNYFSPLSREGDAPNQRARKAIEELQRRLQLPDLPTIDKDYFERLLNGNY